MKLNKTVVIIVVVMALFVQIAIILYNYFTGFIHISSVAAFAVRLMIGTIPSSVFGLMLIYLDIVIINSLNRFLELPQKLIPRIPSEFLLSTIAGVIVGATITIAAQLFSPYSDGLKKNIINNSLITSVINLMIILALEAILWFKRGQETLLKTEKLEKEYSVIRFETLKSQLNPHFLFNSLNVLSSLIRRDSERAQDFIDEFSSVYRYTLDVIEKPVVELREELEFAKSYLYLQKIRFDNSVCTEINIDVTKLNWLVPPLALQTLLENSFKHNRASIENPLNIKIYNEEKLLIIKNNFQPKQKNYDSKGIGINNLTKRYELLGCDQPQFTLTEDEYVARITLIEPE